MAGEGAADAGELDRQEPRPASSPFDSRRPVDGIDKVEVFTTRPDTIFGASFLAVAADHPIAQAAAASDANAAAFIAECKSGGTSAAEIETAEKKGYATGIDVVHPLDPEWRLPVYIANFVLMDYGTGALFGVPGHDQRDFEFASNTAADPSRRRGKHGGRVRADRRRGRKRAGSGGQLAIPRRAIDRTGVGGDRPPRRRGGLGSGDRPISPARLGRLTPALLGHADPDHPLPELRRGPGSARTAPGHVARGRRFSHSGNPLDRHRTWKQVSCPTCGAEATRETDTLDTFVDSSWYFIRFASQPDDKPFDRAEAETWLPVAQYIGGVEHAILHLLYARF